MSDPSTAVAAASFVAVLEPYLVALASAVVSAAVPIAVHAFTRWTGVQIDKTMSDHLRDAAATEAGKLVAQASDNLASAQIDVRSSSVRAAVEAISDKMPGTIAKSGLTPDDLAAFVVGEIGKLQARMTQAPVAAPIPAK